MKYKLLAVSKFPNISGVNIGDYVQALASSQFLPHIDGFIDRDEDLKDYAGEPCKVIMNGWYMHLPQNWPPSDLIDPLFVAFHLNSGVKEVLLSSQSIAYLKSHQPIPEHFVPVVEKRSRCLFLRVHDLDPWREISFRGERG